jgi:hypothetical protein
LGHGLHALGDRPFLFEAIVQIEACGSSGDRRLAADGRMI